VEAHEGRDQVRAEEEGRAVSELGSPEGPRCQDGARASFVRQAGFEPAILHAGLSRSFALGAFGTGDPAAYDTPRLSLSRGRMAHWSALIQRYKDSAREAATSGEGVAAFCSAQPKTLPRG
jgi:hypothetical protein